MTQGQFLRHATSAASLCAGRGLSQWPRTVSTSVAAGSPSSLPQTPGSPTAVGTQPLAQKLKSSPAGLAIAEKRKRHEDRDFLISVLESSATKRDVKAYLQKYGNASGGGLGSRTLLPQRNGIRAAIEKPVFIQGAIGEPSATADDIQHVAIVKLCQPQSWDEITLNGVAKTLTQLRSLGLLSVIVLDFDLGNASSPSDRHTVVCETDRIAKAISAYGLPAAKIVDSTLSGHGSRAGASPFVGGGLFVEFADSLLLSLRAHNLVLVPPLAIAEDTPRSFLAEPNDIVVALTRFLSGLQFDSNTPSGNELPTVDTSRGKLAKVDRIIVIDPLGGTPSLQGSVGSHVFLNLAEEYETTKTDLERIQAGKQTAGDTDDAWRRHLSNLKLAKDALSLLPSSSSVVITSPAEAANLTSLTTGPADADFTAVVGAVGTRRKQNPLIHNLLTDRPIHSASLPAGRIKPMTRGTDTLIPQMPTTTLAKRGMPVTILPDPRITPWAAPSPGSSRLRLTDASVDLPRLVHLINDSFNRKLDVQHYLDRVQNSLAGVVVAGEYEGGAILTWEAPPGMSEEEAFRTGRLVPYLDKFAVLKRSQGAGGVADIVFNAMVRDCFPQGVCWRSRKDNPVNKWYFERSRGTLKLDNSNWAMFWTTPEASAEEQTMKDYAGVCRNVVPSWEDKKRAAD